MTIVLCILAALYIAASGFCFGVATFAEGWLVGIVAFFLWPYLLVRDWVVYPWLERRWNAR